MFLGHFFIIKITIITIMIIIAIIIITIDTQMDISQTKAAEKQ